MDQDAQFFQQHPDRQARIRKPGKVLVKDRQRGVRYEDEMHGEFWSLGPHEPDRRRVIVYRVPPGNPMYDPEKPQLLKIPLLLFADETIEDRDDILLPEVHRIMTDAAKKLVGR
jgi:hypothetical protein